VSDEIKLLLNAIISNQELARAKQESFETEIYKNLNNFKIEVNNFKDEVIERFDNLNIELRGIRRHVDITEKELDRTIIRVEKIEHASH
jgi:hypothetical protein